MKNFKVSFDIEGVNENRMKFVEPELDWVDKILGRRKTPYQQLTDDVADAMAKSLAVQIDHDILTSLKDRS